MGTYTAETPAEALDAMAQDAGYADAADAADVAGPFEGTVTDVTEQMSGPSAEVLAADLDKRGAWDWTDDSEHSPSDRYAVIETLWGWCLVYAGTGPAEVWIHDSQAAAAAHMQDAISE